MTTRLISIAIPFLRRHPKLMALARNIHFRIWRVRVRIRTWRLPGDIDVHKTYWVDPNRIEFACVFEKLEDWDKYRHRGKVIGGNWDQRRIRFTERIGLFRGFEDRFMRGIPWEETEFYQQVLSTVCSGTALWDCRTKAELDQRCRYLDSLFEEMKTNGYRPQHDIAQEERDLFKAEDEISVRIGRNGELLFEDGQHRLAMAKLLNISRVPIKITVIHSHWYAFRREVIDYARKQPWGKLYQPVTHPHLRDIPSVYGEERFEMIKAHLPVQSGDLLDIGAHWGYFCHRFEELGFNCYAVESDASMRYYMEKLRVAENRRFKVICRSILDYREKNDFDVVLALNIFHHFLKSQDTYTKLVELLKRLDMRVMFFQTELPDSPQMIGAYRNFACDEFVDFILENSSLNESTCIGETENGRPLYRLQAL